MIFSEGEYVAFDTETTGLMAWHGDAPFAFAFQGISGQRAYYEMEVDPFTRIVDYRNSTSQDMLQEVREILENQKIIKVMHNGKFDVRITERGANVNVAGPGGLLRDGGRFEETMFMAHVCNSDEMTYKLKYLGAKYAGIDNDDEKDLQEAAKSARRKGKKLGWMLGAEKKPRPDGDEWKGVVQMDYWMPAEIARRHPDLSGEEWGTICRKYATLDVERTLMLFLLYQEMMDEIGVRHSYEKELKLWPTTYRMEERGVRIDPEVNYEEMAFCKQRWDETKAEVEALSWPGINPDSPKQLQKLLYVDLQLPVNPERNTAKGFPGTSVDALKDFENDVQVVRSILRFRAAGKAYGYFARYQDFALPDTVSPGCVIIHADFRQLQAATGRFSCALPNLQQVTSKESSRSADPIDCRRPFGPRPGYVWLHNDYKGMEVRVFADVSEEPNMMEAIHKGIEIHDMVANRGWGGKDNEAGIYEMINVLGLNGSEHGHDDKVRWIWNEWGLSPDQWDSLSQRNRHDFAAEFLSRYNWDIINAQKAVDKKVTKNKSKMVTFAKIYGGGPDAVKDLLHITFNEAREFMRQYDRSFPRVQEYMKEMEAVAKSDGCIWNRWDRRLEVPYQFAYKSVNYMVQGSSADLLKAAMIKCDQFLQSHQIDAHLIMTIHDELVFEVRQEELTHFLVRNICRIMEDTEGRLRVSMPTDPSVVRKAWVDKDKIELSLSPIKKVPA